MRSSKRVYLAYAHENRTEVRQVDASLRRSGVDTWLDLRELRPGDELLAEFAKAIEKVDYVCVALTPAALTSPWVMAELRMALTAEIERGRPTVVALLLQDCEVPSEVRHKLHIDFRGRFGAAVQELSDHISEGDVEVSPPKQAVIGRMIREANSEIWSSLTMGFGPDDWSKEEFADCVQGLTSPELEGAVAVGSRWSGSQHKWWERDLIDVLGAAPRQGKRLLHSLEDKGFLERATDLDYADVGESAWCDTSALWILRRSARRSGLFSYLPPPVPERLSAALAYDHRLSLNGKGWYALRFAQPVQGVLSEVVGPAVLTVVRRDPPATWLFRSPADRHPLCEARFHTIGDFATARSGEDEYAFVPFSLQFFDDLGLLGTCS